MRIHLRRWVVLRVGRDGNRVVSRHFTRAAAVVGVAARGVSSHALGRLEWRDVA